MKMKPKDFVTAYLPFAKQTEASTGIAASATLTQAALESGWGEAVVGNSFFGVKDTDGINGNEQLVTTTEYSRRQDLKFPVIISVTPVTMNGRPMFKYKVKDYFRKYKTPAECFTDHANFFLNNARYGKALGVKKDASAFLSQVALAGYATAPNYNDTLQKVLKMILPYTG